MKLSLILKLFGFVCLLSVFSIPAQSAEPKYDFKCKDTPVETALLELRKISGYDFVYQKELLKDFGTVTCNYSEMSLPQILNRIFDENDISYQIVDKTIILSKSEKEQPYFKSTLSGTVVDQNDEPLPGATVMLEGTTQGVSADVDGQFAIILEKGYSALRVSYVGMKTAIVKLKPGEKFVMVRLQPSDDMLSEVIVTGYQNLKRESATGSYQTISAKDLDAHYAASVTANLEGKVPGLLNYDNGNGSAMTIRGTSSFEASTSPLIVVDGLPIEGSIESVNPYDIENITVLKDAAAAAIYGARASNGVIVITTKRGISEKLSVEFNTDITVSEHNDYDYMGWASASEMVELEGYNFDYISKSDDRNPYNSLLNFYRNGRSASISPATLLYLRNHLGEISNDQLNTALDKLRSNDYHKEWQDAAEKTQVLQQYNLAMRVQGKALSSSIVINYRTDNNGKVNEHNNALSFSYKGNLKVASWLDLMLGAHVVSERAKLNGDDTGWSNITSFMPYESMYSDGQLRPMLANMPLDSPLLSDPLNGLKSTGYNFREELGLNTLRQRRTNIRTYLHSTFKLLPGWTASAQFQYEDIYFKQDRLHDGESYKMREMYNLYTIKNNATGQVSHYIPDGGILRTDTEEGAFWTFRASTQYENTFAEKHEISAVGGFEYREQHTKSGKNILMGYDDRTQTNSNGMVNWSDLTNLSGTSSIFGPDYPMFGAPESDSFGTADILHRFYSLYLTGNYVYDRRYSVAGSFRIDKADLFGADPKYRGRPLWSVGLSWNMHNESFLRDNTWIDVLKLRYSHGLTGNIAQNFSSYLTATIGVNDIYGYKYAALNTPPNDHLRWEKTRTNNIGVDFAFWNYILSGSVDFYHKSGTDLLTVTDIDPTTGWTSLTINNGSAVNKGIELQLNSHVIKANSRNDVGLDLGFNISYNHNKVTKVGHNPATGQEALYSHTLHKGYPVNSLFSYDFAGMVTDGDMQYFSWRDHKGDIHTTDISSDEFTVNDIVYSGALDPKTIGSFTPEVTWRGFSLSALLSWYAGHSMRVNTEQWTAEGSMYGYRGPSQIEAIPSSYLDYWRSGDKSVHVANGYLGGSHVIGTAQYMDSNVVPADFLTLRNIVLGYSFSPQICKKLSLQDLRLRFQANNVHTWVRNDFGIDPEANNPITGEKTLRVPRSYTMSLYVKF